MANKFKCDTTAHRQQLSSADRSASGLTQPSWTWTWLAYRPSNGYIYSFKHRLGVSHMMSTTTKIFAVHSPVFLSFYDRTALTKRKGSRPFRTTTQDVVFPITPSDPRTHIEGCYFFGPMSTMYVAMIHNHSISWITFLYVCDHLWTSYAFCVSWVDMLH